MTSLSLSLVEMWEIELLTSKLPEELVNKAVLFILVFLGACYAEKSRCRVY